VWAQNTDDPEVPGLYDTFDSPRILGQRGRNKESFAIQTRMGQSASPKRGIVATRPDRLTFWPDGGIRGNATPIGVAVCVRVRL
jgi:hypothetical protein